MEITELTKIFGFQLLAYVQESIPKAMFVNRDFFGIEIQKMAAVTQSPKNLQCAW